MKMKSFVKKISSIAIFLSYLIIGLMILFVISSRASDGEPAFLGYQIKSVLSGSMEPGIKTGSIIVINTDEDVNRFKSNDVITFNKDESMVVTHRIVEVIDKDGKIMYRTKGDNNDTTDQAPVIPQNIIGKYTGFTIPYVGYLIEFLKSRNGIMLLFILPGVLLIGYSVLKVKKIIKEFENENRKSNLNVE